MMLKYVKRRCDNYLFVVLAIFKPNIKRRDFYFQKQLKIKRFFFTLKLKLLFNLRLEILPRYILSRLENFGSSRGSREAQGSCPFCHVLPPALFLPPPLPKHFWRRFAPTLVHTHSLACPAVWTVVDAAATTPWRSLRSAETVLRVTGVAEVSFVTLVVTAAVAVRSDVRGGGVCRPVTVVIGSERALRNKQIQRLRTSAK